MSAADVLVDHAYKPTYDAMTAFCRCGWTERIANTHKTTMALHAAHQVDALKASGYAVVELPEADLPDTYDFGEYCTAAWNAPPNEVEWYSVAVFGEDGDIELKCDEDLKSGEARVLARVLLAAANAAEAAE